MEAFVLIGFLFLILLIVRALRNKALDEITNVDEELSREDDRQRSKFSELS